MSAEITRGPGHDFPLRHGADPLNVDVESWAFMVGRDKEISDCGKD